MAGKKIMYVHGFGSSAQSGTVKILQELMPNSTVIADDVPLHPEEAISMLKGMAEQEAPDLIIGTSMGGMYTEQLYGYDRIIINPAFQMGETMHDHGMMGKQVFQNPRKDGVQEFIVTKQLVKEYEWATQQCFSNVNEEEQQHVWGLFGDQDPLVHTFDLFRNHYPQAIRFHGEHRLNDKVALHDLIPVIRWIDDKQKGTERPIVYISIATLMDRWGKAASSMHKAYEMLIEHYEVFIVAPSPTHDEETIPHTQQWVEEYLSTPAWNHIIFTNQKRLLYGDYFIDYQPDKDFMGTAITFGSSDMKTWEDLIVFFERLGGQ